jgi:drug/metabolite transporter (DMT)-like permease
MLMVLIASMMMSFVMVFSRKLKHIHYTNILTWYVAIGTVFFSVLKIFDIRIVEGELQNLTKMDPTIYKLMAIIVVLGALEQVVATLAY